ncbi:MAG: 1-acyl-sn-glycerol-3-phosphate acyltransferase [Holophagales bacterium]|jgi:1-acyl-sn-glycerol-3-phosphate acyltransferase|nr:1-acyl-sn-glycerol-3-phosphate acyltransferase [Holophagales bacterium]
MKQKPKHSRSILAVLWSAFLVPWGIFSVGLTGLAILIALPFVGGKRAFFAIGKLWAKQQLWLCGASWDSVGWENVPEEIRNGQQSAIFMSNHQSLLDPPLLMGAIPVPAVYIAKKELQRVPFVGWAAAAAGMIFIDRGNSEKAAISLARAAEQIASGKNVVIFPEGTRTMDGRIGKFKKGGFGLAVRAGVPIVPLVTIGGWDILPKGELMPRRGKISVMFGRAVYPKDYPSREALMIEVETQIRDMADLYWARSDN